VESAVYDYLVVLVIILVLGDSGAAAGMLLHVCNASVTHLTIRDAILTCARKPT